jgi:hypothetical protein
MTQEQKPAGTDPATNIERPSRETLLLARDALAEEALQLRAAERPSTPNPDKHAGDVSALRALKHALEARAAASRDEDYVDTTGVAPLRQAHRVPPLSFEPQLSRIAHPQAPDVRDAADTESILNGLIAECHFLMREVAFRTICDSRDPLDRLRFLDVTLGMMKAGARVGDTVARLRHGDVKEIRQSYLHEETRRSSSRPEGAG